MTSRKVIGRAPLNRASKSISEFCRSHGISRATFDNWRKAGLAPATTQVIPKGRVLISEEAERAWLARHTAIANAITTAAE
jgi:predicted site-specific integrase-resolvase